MGHERSGHVAQYRSLSKEHIHRVRGRLFVVVLAAAFGLPLLARVNPIPLFAVVIGVGLLGWHGRGKDRPLVDHAVMSSAAARKLTPDMVVRAFTAAKLCKEDTPVTFAHPIARDGKGWLAVIDLPYGSKASDAIKRREDIAAGLDIDEVQVFLTRHRGTDGSARRVSLWVADTDPYAEKPPVSPLAVLESVDFWKPWAFGLDARRRPVNMLLVWSGLLVGAIPRMGKTFAARIAACAAALDAYVQLLVFDGKGGKDWQPFEGVAHRYGSGVRTAVVEHLVRTLRELVVEMNRRYEVFRKLPNDRCPEGKLTPALSRDKRLRMPLVLLCIDEVQRYLEHPEYGAIILELLVELAKVGPAAGIMLVLATQRPDSKVLPEGLRGQIGTRFALKVMNWQSSDTILGAGASTAGLDASKLLQAHKGVGILLGADDGELAEAGGQTVRTYLLDLATVQRVVDRGRELRAKAGTLTGIAAGEDLVDEAPARNLLDDVREVFGAGEPKLWSEVIASRLAERWPDAYDGWSAADISTMLGKHGIRTAQVWGQTPDGVGANRRGIALEAVMEALGSAGAQ
jgi:S-DNA-T family DNA segregation ATPase FtsK/SpoIIIE